MQRQKHVIETKRKSVGWRMVTKGVTVESGRGQITQDPVACLVGPSSLPPPASHSHAVTLTVTPIKEALEMLTWGIKSVYTFKHGGPQRYKYQLLLLDDEIVIRAFRE